MVTTNLIVIGLLILFLLFGIITYIILDCILKSIKILDKKFVNKKAVKKTKELIHNSKSVIIFLMIFLTTATIILGLINKNYEINDIKYLLMFAIYSLTLPIYVFCIVDSFLEASKIIDKKFVNKKMIKKTNTYFRLLEKIDDDVGISIMTLVMILFFKMALSY
jgi:hypothetical protein